MTDAYEHQSFYNSNENLSIIDCRDLEGTRCYLDDYAKEQLLERMEAASLNGIHFIDSGNYHYLSLLWLILTIILMISHLASGRLPPVEDGF